MAKKKKNQKLKKQIKDTFILTIIISAIIFVLYKIIILITSPTNTFILKENKISVEDSKAGYVIREEYVVKSENDNQNIELIKNEGERIAANQPIYKYYSVDEENIEKEIEELNNEIQEALLGQTDLFSSDVKAIENQIGKQIENLKNRSSMQEIKECKNNLSNYIVKKAKIAGSLSSAGQYINGLIEKRNSLEKELTNGAKYVYSDKSGVVSYRIDNLEDTFSIENLDNLSLDYINSLNLKTGQIVGKTDDKVKIINNYECYIAVQFGKEIEDLTKEGKAVRIRLANQEEIKATVYKIKEDKGDFLVIFKITDGVENLINYRKISLDIIWWSYEGLMIPKTAILYEDGLSYVVRNRNGEFEKVLVDIVKENDKYCIIDNYDSEDLSQMGFGTEEIKNIKKIKLYDEIVVNPEIE